MAKKEVIDIRDEILGILKKEDRRLPWLAKQTGISYNHLYSVLKKKDRTLTEENKKLISKALNASF